MGAPNEDQTEKPTEKRLEEARGRGQFARAPELGMAAGLLAAGLLLRSSGERQALALADFSVRLFGHLDPRLVTVQNIASWCPQAVAWLAGLCLPVLTGVAVAGLVAGGAQSRFAISAGVFANALSRLNPLQGAARIFSWQGVVRLVLDAAKLLVAAALLYGGIRALLGDPVFYTPVALERLGGLLQARALDLLLRLAAATALLGGLHYLYQWRKSSRELAMSRHEVKEEMREANGDPHIKSARRQMARRLLQKQMLAAVPTADVIITNPTHYAVVLKYERGRDDAPVVLAKGQGAFARRLKALAQQHEVPMVENRPVARALYKSGRVGEPIPGPLYRAVAEILGYVFRTHRYYFHQLKARRLDAERSRT